MKTHLIGFGSVLALFVAVVAFSGCSTDSPMSPMTFGADNSVNIAPLKEEPRDQRDSEFRLNGEIVKVDADRPLVILTAKMDSDRDETERDFSLEVSKNATVVLLRDRVEVSFDAKYFIVGSQVTASGSILRDGSLLADRFEIWQEGSVVTTSSSTL
jgi:hypothetical protein